MIPSRPLHFADIFSETFAITTRTFPRYLLLFLVCIAPATWLMTRGVIDGMTTTVRIAQRHYNFTDQDLTALRNIFRDTLARSNPAFRSEIESIEEDRVTTTDSLAAISGARSSTDSASTALGAESATRDTNRVDSLFHAIQARPRVHASQVFEEHLADIFAAMQAFFVGFLLYIIGYGVLLAGVTELSVQVFEARRQRLGFALKRIFQHHLWTVLAILILYGIAAFALWILAIAVGEIRYAGPILDAAFFIFWGFATLGLSLAIPISVSENVGPIAAFKRSWLLTNGSKLRILGTALVLGVILFGILLFMSVITSALFMGLSLEFWRHVLRDPQITVNWLLDGMARLIASSMLANTVTSIFTLSLPVVFITVFYYDLRTRREGPLTYDEPAPTPQPALWQP